MSKMNRRDFLYRALTFSAAGLLVPPILRRWIPLGATPAFAESGGLSSSLAAPLAGRVLVWINLSGGSDGLNAVIPFMDPLYYQKRPTIAIPASQVVHLNGMTGIHPAMAALQPIFASGKLAIIQGVGYPDMNLSHFRGTDIWFSGSSSDAIVETGWIARFIEEAFPSFPAQLPESPYGLQQSDSHRIPLLGNRGLIGVVVDDPSSFYYLVNQNYPGDWHDTVAPTRGGQELDFLRELDRETLAYAGAIQAASDAGQNTESYPATTLGSQLQIVARLMSGGLETPIYLTSEYGFDTHASEGSVQPTILGSVANSIFSFWTDITNQGFQDRVVVMTTSEFGRRVEENGSHGTDHGTAAPHFVLGSQVHGGFYGTNPNLANLDPNGNLLVQNDYRSLFGTVLWGHFGASDSVLHNVFGGDFPRLGFLDIPTGVALDTGGALADRLHTPSPNPMREGQRCEIRYDLARSMPVSITIYDIQGRRVATIVDGPQAAGPHLVEWKGERLPAGTYLIRMETPTRRIHAKLVVLT